MGSTEANFGAVSTEGLVQRFRNRIAAAKEGIGKTRFMRQGTKRRHQQQLDLGLALVETEYALVRSGVKPEGPFRDRLIQTLDPGLSGGAKRTHFKW